MALDLGTTKFCIATILSGRRDGDLPTPSIKTVSVAADGMRRGMVSSLEKAKIALCTLLEIAEKELNLDIDKVVVGIAGSHLKSRFVTVEAKIDRYRVDPPTLYRIESLVHEQFSLLNREFLHTIPSSYQIDNRGWIDDPLGQTGYQLLAKYFVVEADRHYVSDVVTLCNQCGLTVSRMYAEPLASSSVISSDEAKTYGLVTADIGGGTTDGVVFISGKPVKTFTIDIGGKLMTNDLAIGLGIPFDEAERIKLQFGLSHYGSSLTALESRNLQDIAVQIPLEKIRCILGARIKELCKLLYEEISEFKTQLGSGIVLTGGGSEVRGAQHYVAQLLGNDVKKEVPVFSGWNSVHHQNIASKYATVVGLLKMEYLRIENTRNLRKSPVVERYFQLFLNWVKELS